jgi:hypothetical protein
MPLARWAWTLAEQYLARDLPQRWAHVRAAAGRAAHVGHRLLAGADRELLIATTLVHDIGYAPPLVESGFHPLDGARFLVREGGPARLCNLVAHHSAAAAEARLLGLAEELAEFPDEGTVLRDALWYCDMSTDATGEPVSFDARIAGIRARHEPGSTTVRALDAGGYEARLGAFRRTELRLAGLRLDVEPGSRAR